MSVQSEINRINEAKADIQSALAEKGVDASTHSLSELGNDVRSISVGGSVNDVIIGGNSVVEDGIAIIPECLPLILTKGVHYVDSEEDLPPVVEGKLMFVKRA